ncbi:MAG: hypothetical protein Q9222_001944 [Ikaeria aurantiellina]
MTATIHDRAQDQSLMTKPPTIQVDYSWRKWHTRVFSDDDPSRTLFIVKYQMIKAPHLIVKTPDCKEIIGTGTLHPISINAKYEVHGRKGQMKALKRWKTSYTHLSHAYASDPDAGLATMTWTSDSDFKTWDFICLDEEQMPVAKFSANLWSLKRIGKIEFLGPKAHSQAAQEEIVVTGLTLAYTMILRTTSLLSFFGAIVARPGPIQNGTKVFGKLLGELIEASNGRVVFVALDTTDPTSIRDAFASVESKLGGRGLDVLINNAGIMPVTKGGVEAMGNLSETLNTNVKSVHQVTSTFLPLLRKGVQKRVFNMLKLNSSTTLGSMTLAANYHSMPVPAYKVSKAALNMLTVQYAIALEKEGFTFVAISPGWLKTDMGAVLSADADLSVEDGATAVLEVVHKYGKESSGKFYNIRVSGWENNEGLNRYDGKIPPW